MILHLQYWFLFNKNWFSCIISRKASDENNTIIRIFLKILILFGQQQNNITVIDFVLTIGNFEENISLRLQNKIFSCFDQTIFVKRK